MIRDYLQLILLITLPAYSIAEPLLYGSLSYQIEAPYQSYQSYRAPTKGDRESRQNIRGTIGIEGAHPLGNGNALIYQFEWGNQNYKRPPTKELSPYQHP